MYAYIKGFVKLIEPNHIVLDNGGIGFLIYSPNPYAFKLDEEQTVYIYQHVREDLLTLYGFKSYDEKNLFLKLLSVKGIGPKGAMAILATGTVSGIIDAIERENIIYLKKFPGIGPKAAQQIVLDLKGKLALPDNIVIDDKIEDVKSALEALGYKKKDISKVLPNLDSSKNNNELVKDALKMLLK